MPCPRPWASTTVSSSTARWPNPDHVVDIPAAAVDEQFIGNLSRLIHRLGSGGPARKVPSRMECGYCDITAADCPERAADGRVEEGATEDF